MANFPYNRKTLQRVAEQIEELQRSSLRIYAHPRTDREFPVGISKFGGEPDLPTTIPWPRGTLQIPEPTPLFKETYPDEHYLPPDGSFSLPFLAQINLSDARPYDREGLLPTTGMLYFFLNNIPYPSDTGPGPLITDLIRNIKYSYYGYNDPERWRVLYVETDTSVLQPRVTPNDIPARAVYDAQRITFSQEWTTPALPTCFITDGDYTIPSLLRLRMREARVYGNWHYLHRTEVPVHQMLGYGDDIQDFGMERSYLDMRARFFPELPALNELTIDEQLQELTQGRLLLQISELENGMHFGRSGRLFIYIREPDLRRQDFTKVWIEMH